MGLRLVVAAEWPSRERARAWEPRSGGIARKGRLPRVMQRGSKAIIHAWRGPLAFVYLRGILGSVPPSRSERSPLCDGALGSGDDGIPPDVGTLSRAGGIATRLDRDSKGARIEAGNTAREGLRRSIGRFL